MKTIRRVKHLFVIFTALLLGFGIVRADAALLYSPKQYNNLYNEKVAVELELRALKARYNNEKSNFESRIQDLEGRIDTLNKKIAMLGEQRKEDQAQCDERVRKLQETIDILQKKSGDREKNLIEENKKLQARYEEELKKLRQMLQEARDKALSDLDAMKKGYEAKVNDLQARINSLTDEIASLRNLTKAQKAELDRMSEQANELEKQLENEIKQGQIRLKRFHNRLIINIDDRISFDSGSAELKKEILPALSKITKILADYPENTINVEGHTDNVPIRTKQFRDNWQLSTERALAVLGYILKNKSLNKSRFAAAGYGEYNPIVANDTPANRSLNRRVDIVVIPRVTK